MATYTSWVLFTAVSLLTEPFLSSSPKSCTTTTTTTTTRDFSSLQSPTASLCESSSTLELALEEQVESVDAVDAQLVAAEDLAQHLVKLDRTASWIKSNRISTSAIESEDVWDSNSFTELYAATFGSQAPFRDGDVASVDLSEAKTSGEQLTDSKRFDRMVSMYPLWKPSGSCSSGSSDWDAESDLDELDAASLTSAPLSRTASTSSISTRSTTASRSSSYISYFFGRSRSTSSLDGSCTSSRTSIATSDTSSQVESFDEKEMLGDSWAEKIGSVEMIIIAAF